MSNPQVSIDELSVSTIRLLSVDMVQKANSGHPGLPLGSAPMAYVLWSRFLRFNPQDPKWPNRDRFVLSAGHGSALLYSMLHLYGYDLSLDDLKQFRQSDSKTPGHPESHITPGVEVTTGPLGQGFANGVGMAMSEVHLGALYNKEGHAPVQDHYTYVLVSDGDLMEGIASEAASLAGHLQLGKMIYLYDDNNISLDGPTNLTYTENPMKRFDAYYWHTQHVTDGNDLDAIENAIRLAQSVTDKPSIIAVRTIIGFGSPLAGTSKAHGSPLGVDNVKITKKFYGFDPEKTFQVPDEVYAHLREPGQRGAKLQSSGKRILRNTQRIIRTRPRCSGCLLMANCLKAGTRTCPLTRPPMASWLPAKRRVRPWMPSRKRCRSCLAARPIWLPATRWTSRVATPFSGCTRPIATSGGACASTRWVGP